MSTEEIGSITFKEVVEQIGICKINRKTILVHDTTISISGLSYRITNDGRQIKLHVEFSDGTLISFQDLQFSGSIMVLNKKIVRFSVITIEQLKKFIGLDLHITFIGTMSVTNLYKERISLEAYLLTII